MSVQSLIKEGVAVALVVVVVGIVLHQLSLKVYGPHNLNNKGMYALHLAATVFVSHLLLEWAGANRWYCVHGTACLKK